MHSVGVVTLLSFTTCAVCQSAVLPRRTLQFSTSQSGSADVAGCLAPPDAGICIGYSGATSQRLLRERGPARTCTKEKKQRRSKNIEFLGRFRVSSGYSWVTAQDRSFSMPSVATEECHLFLTSFDSRYSNNSVVM